MMIVIIVQFFLDHNIPNKEICTDNFTKMSLNELQKYCRKRFERITITFLKTFRLRHN